MRFSFLPALIFLPLLAAGCSSDWDSAGSPESPRQNSVEYVTLTHEVHFAAGASEPSAAEERSLADFLARAALDYGDRVTITGAALDAVAAQRVAAVTGDLRRIHLVNVTVAQAAADTQAPRDTLEVSVGRYVVLPPKCPDWTAPSGSDFSNHATSNYGCASTTDLGAMVANPADLVHGAPPGSADAEFAARGVQRYRNGDISKSLQTDTAKAPGAAPTAGGGN